MKYEKPQIEITELTTEDVITTSGFDNVTVGGNGIKWQ